MTQIRPDELIRILRGELEAIAAGAGAALLGYDENGAFAGDQNVTGANSIGMGDTTTVAGDYAIVGGGHGNSAAADYATIGGGRDSSISALATHAPISGGRNTTLTQPGGDYATTGGGRSNLISSSNKYNIVGGGYRNTIGGTSQLSTISGGGDNTINAGDFGHVIGGGFYNLIDSGRRNLICGGGYNEIGGADPQGCTISGGLWNLITGTGLQAAIPGGTGAKADKRSQIVTSGSQFAVIGDAQGTIQFVCRRKVGSHVLNQWYYIGLGGAAVGAEVAASTAWTVHCLIVGITQNAAQQWGYELIGLIERDNAGNTTLAGQTLRVIFESDANYIAQLIADDANEELEVQVRRTGGVDYNVRWVATIRTAEVSYP